MAFYTKFVRVKVLTSMVLDNVMVFIAKEYIEKIKNISNKLTNFFINTLNLIFSDLIFINRHFNY